MSFLSSSKCTLIMGDEGLQIFNVGGFGTKFVDFVPWETVDFEDSVSQIIVRKCKRRPVVVLNDMVEQHYRKETIPKVSVLDRKNVLDRRLAVAFPNYRVRAALKLKERVPPGKGGSYLFAAIPTSDPYNKMMRAIAKSMAPISGLYLLPIEAAAMVSELSKKVNKGKRHKAAWTIFVGQHHGGGLRQIVTRNGTLALTRMTPIVDTDIEPELWVKEVAGELSSTMSYLSRFGYKETDGLDVVVIANESSVPSLEAMLNIDCNLTVLTSKKAASLLGVQIGKQEDMRYADPLHATYLSKKNKFILPMQSNAIDRLIKPRRVASYVIMALLALLAYVGYSVFQSGNDSIKVKDDLTVAVQRNQSLREEYKRELAKKKEMGFDFQLVNASIDVYEEVTKGKMKPLPIIREIGRALGPDVSLDKIVFKTESEEVESENPYGYSADSGEPEKVFFTKAVMTISFPNTVDPDVGVSVINSLRDRLADSLPEYDVNIAKQVADLSYTGNFVGEAGTSSIQESNPEEYTAEIEVRGLM